MFCQLCANTVDTRVSLAMDPPPSPDRGPNGKTIRSEGGVPDGFCSTERSLVCVCLPFSGCRTLVVHRVEKGCLHHKLRRHHVALHYFQKALEALGRGSAAKENGAPPSGRAGGAGGGTRGGGRASRGDAGGGAATADGHMSPAPTCEILYNTGLQLLLTDKPQEVMLCVVLACRG